MADGAEEVTAILARLADDLDAVFVDLFRAYQRIVYSTALGVCRRPADAEDVTAEAFLHAYRALRGYDRRRIAALQPRAWLVTIMLNAWRNTGRTTLRRPRQVPLDEAVDPPDRSDSVERIVERHETGRELAALLARLPEAQRVAVVLRHVGGLSIAEVAAAADADPLPPGGPL